MSFTTENWCRVSCRHSLRCDMLDHVLELREMRLGDLPAVAAWLRRRTSPVCGSPGRPSSTSSASCAGRSSGIAVLNALIVRVEEQPIGWCQWCPCRDDPAWAADVGAQPRDLGIGYAIGDPGRVGVSLGTTLIMESVRLIRSKRPSVGVIADPYEANVAVTSRDLTNVASRRVLEKNGFSSHLKVATLPLEPTDDAMAVYRLPTSS